MAYNTLTKIGTFGVCQDVGTDHFYVSAYVPDKKVMVYRSLHTSNLEDAIVTVRDLVERGVEGDPIDALAKKALRTVADVLEFHRPVFEQQASAEFNDIAVKRMTRLMGDRLLKGMVKRDFDNFKDQAMAEGLALSTVSRTLTVLRSACKEAVGERRLARHHVPRIPYFLTKNHVRAAPPKGRPMSPAEIASAIDRLEFQGPVPRVRCSILRRENSPRCCPKRRQQERAWLKSSAPARTSFENTAIEFPALVFLSNVIQ